MADRKQDQPDTLSMLREAMDGDLLCNATTGRYLSDHIEELIEVRVKAERQAAIDYFEMVAQHTADQSTLGKAHWCRASAEALREEWHRSRMDA
jgi:hypothetical protein